MSKLLLCQWRKHSTAGRCFPRGSVRNRERGNSFLDRSEFTGEKKLFRDGNALTPALSRRARERGRQIRRSSSPTPPINSNSTQLPLALRERVGVRVVALLSSVEPCSSPSGDASPGNGPNCTKIRLPFSRLQRPFSPSDNLSPSQQGQSRSRGLFAHYIKH